MGVTFPPPSQPPMMVNECSIDGSFGSSFRATAMLVRGPMATTCSRPSCLLAASSSARLPCSAPSCPRLSRQQGLPKSGCWSQCESLSQHHGLIHSESQERAHRKDIAMGYAHWPLSRCLCENQPGFGGSSTPPEGYASGTSPKPSSP